MTSKSKREIRRQQEAKASLYKKYEIDKHKVLISSNDIVLKFPNGFEVVYPPYFFLALHIKTIVEKAFDAKLSNEENNQAKNEASMLLSMIIRFEIDFQSAMEKKVKEHVELMLKEEKQAKKTKKTK